MKTVSYKYDHKEEFWNVLTHAFGIVLSVAALSFLVIYSSLYLTVWHIVSYSIYGASLVLLYSASTAYHSSKNPKIRHRLNIFDHSAIYLLIAGTYTPLLLVTLRGPWGWSLFGVVWGIAILGIVFKLFYTGKYNRISTLAYIGMGWIAVIAIHPLIMNLAVPGLIWLLLGGLFYTVGAVFYLQDKMSYNHAIFHVFVLLGSISHFLCIFLYV
ncbi:MAG: hemolysin III family protein [Bacteroidia bacterium]|nr:hemolysin III family protein [Bacteroidia bacterium]